MLLVVGGGGEWLLVVVVVIVGGESGLAREEKLTPLDNNTLQTPEKKMMFKGVLFVLTLLSTCQGYGQVDDNQRYGGQPCILLQGS